jgi:hypothetical protein
MVTEDMKIAKRKKKAAQRQARYIARLKAAHAQEQASSATRDGIDRAEIARIALSPEHKTGLIAAAHGEDSTEWKAYLDQPFTLDPSPSYIEGSAAACRAWQEREHSSLGNFTGMFCPSDFISGSTVLQEPLQETINRHAETFKALIENKTVKHEL